MLCPECIAFYIDINLNTDDRHETIKTAYPSHYDPDCIAEHGIAGTGR
jgi:hypothetical protein